MALDKPIFIDTDPEVIVQDMIAWYETETGKTLQPAQIERILINAFAYREALIRNQINEAARQNLVDFAVAPVLDYLGALVGVSRLPESSAYTTIRFNLVNGHGGVVVPDGTRVQTSDGKYIFATQEPVTVAIGVYTVDILCLCETPGVGANGYVAGTVNILLDPLVYVSSGANIDTSSGGGDEETDEQLRERIKLAPEAYSTAGSVGAYKFHAKSADPSIIDVAVIMYVPGTVRIFPLVEGGIATPVQVLNAVAAKCSDEKVRPLTDTVQVLSPTQVTYSLSVNLTVLPDADNTTVIQQVTDALTAFADSRKATLGRDVLKSQITALCMVDKVYDVSIIAPVSDVIISETEFAYATSITVNISGINAG